jgi:hypothetical protein
MAIDLSAADHDLLDQYVEVVLRRFRDGEKDFDETRGKLVDTLVVIARGDPDFQRYLRASIDNEEP